MKQFDLLPLLNFIDPSSLSYTQWIEVGMALKTEGYTCDVWDNWSKNDSRYHAGECFLKWDSFKSDGITGATITEMAKRNGWQSGAGIIDQELAWDAVIDNDYTFVDTNYLEEIEVYEPKNWNPKRDIEKYITTLFDTQDYICYVTSSYLNKENGRYSPSEGHYDRTLEALLRALSTTDDVSNVFGDIDPNVGAWICFNPVDGKGRTNKNITDFRYALVESDNQSIGRQNAILRELQLPIATLVHSGKKSLHAVIRVDASSYEEYKKRVDYLYNVCKKNGLEIDKQNRNPSRLTRFPGFVRGDQKQFLIATNLGKSNWEEWFEYIEDLNDNLPNFEALSETWNDMPNLADELITGVLRQGHKMLMAGPSKAGKSFALIELAIAIAEGTTWLNWPCRKGRVLYVNLELDRPSCLHRFKDVYHTLQIAPNNIKNIDIWNLRGNSAPLDKLAPRLIRRSEKKQYTAIIIDPIYKVLTGDENSADQMAYFTNQFDKVATELGASIIYCHHHSKGAQGGKRSMDRASGSGVFARDPDALIDLIELELDEHNYKHQISKHTCAYYKSILQQIDSSYLANQVSDDDLFSRTRMREHCQKFIKDVKKWAEIDRVIEQIKERCMRQTAWRIEGTLREFPKFQPVNMWFDYPIHRVDNTGVLADLETEGEQPAWKKPSEKKVKKPVEKVEEKQNEIEIAFSSLELDGSNEPVTIDDLAIKMGVSTRTAWRRVSQHPNFEIIKNDKKGRGNHTEIRRKTDQNQL